MPKFEQVSSNPSPQKRIEGMKHLMSALPEANRSLLNWIFVHMGHVIERERFNKMTLQNVSIVLSPTMKISHRVLNCFFENSHILFDGMQLKKYVPPITASGAGSLPEAEPDIAEEIGKQESLLADLHLQISSGAASKKTEEQIWEQQRIGMCQ
jgi:RalA-binding protein 1